MPDFDTILAPLVGICNRRDLIMRWRTYERDGVCHATVQAGQRNGAQPKWGGKGDTREAALTEAASHACSYWDQPDQIGISTTLLDLVRASKA